MHILGRLTGFNEPGWFWLFLFSYKTEIAWLLSTRRKNIMFLSGYIFARIKIAQDGAHDGEASGLQHTVDTISRNSITVYVVEEVAYQPSARDTRRPSSRFFSATERANFFWTEVLLLEETHFDTKILMFRK